MNDEFEQAKLGASVARWKRGIADFEQNSTGGETLRPTREKPNHRRTEMSDETTPDEPRIFVKFGRSIMDALTFQKWSREPFDGAVEYVRADTRPAPASEVTEAMVEAGAQALYKSEMGYVSKRKTLDEIGKLGPIYRKKSKIVLQAALAHNAAQPDAGLVAVQALRDQWKAEYDAYCGYGGGRLPRERELANMITTADTILAALKGAAK